MKRSVARTLILASALICASIPLVAHHGTNASYDPTKKVMLNGVITSFTWRNPHAFVEFDVTDPKGTVVHWVGEMNSPMVLKAAGWTATTLKPGDHITMTVNPSRAGTAVCVIDRTLPVFVNGKQALGTGDSQN